VRDREQRRKKQAYRRWSEALRDREQKRENRVVVKEMRIGLKRRRFGFAPYRTRPDPYQNRTGFFFFLAKNRYTRGTHAAVPRQYPYPQGTRYGYGGVFAVPVLPRPQLNHIKLYLVAYYCFLGAFPING
jgi:hypothetical protein